MLTWGYAKHPRKQIKDSQRIAVRPIQAYRCVHGRIQGAPFNQFAIIRGI